jgi:hypothetical protein
LKKTKAKKNEEEGEDCPINFVLTKKQKKSSRGTKPGFAVAASSFLFAPTGVHAKSDLLFTSKTRNCCNFN